MTGGTLAYAGAVGGTVATDGSVAALAVDGDLTLDGATVDVSGNWDDLTKSEQDLIPVLTVTGKLSGTCVRKTADPNWVLKVKADGLYLKRVKGLTVLIR